MKHSFVARFYFSDAFLGPTVHRSYSLAHEPTTHSRWIYGVQAASSQSSSLRSKSTIPTAQKTPSQTVTMKKTLVQPHLESHSFFLPKLVICKMTLRTENGSG